jgi:hypothetical protein
MSKIELIYHTGCPNLDLARDVLGTALDELQMSRDWIEWNSDDDSAPDYAKRFASPTILIDGKDVGNAGSSDFNKSCRVYNLGDGKMAGVPTVEMIKKELSKFIMEKSE